MKNKITRSLIVLALLCVTVITLMSFCACQKDDGGSSPDVTVTYNKVLSSLIRAYFDDMTVSNNWSSGKDVKKVISQAELEEYSELGITVSNNFFETKTILLIPFHYASSDKYVAFKDLAIKDGKIYPVCITGAPIPVDGLFGTTDDIRLCLFAVSVDNDRISDCSIEEALVVNVSAYHNTVRSVFN